jgi:hypothetical protein
MTPPRRDASVFGVQQGDKQGQLPSRDEFKEDFLKTKPPAGPTTNLDINSKVGNDNDVGFKGNIGGLPFAGGAEETATPLTGSVDAGSGSQQFFSSGEIGLIFKTFPILKEFSKWREKLKLRRQARRLLKSSSA